MAVIIKDKEGNQKHYETVAERMRKFREKFPVDSGWRILSEISFPDPDTVLCKASILNPEGIPVAVGTAEEMRNVGAINRTSAVENCETSAMGRALFSAGFGGGEFCSADELHAALTKARDLDRIKNNPPDSNQHNAKPDAPPPPAAPSNPPKNDIPHQEQFDFLQKLGLGLRVDNGRLCVTEMEKGMIYKHRGILKSSGFQFDSRTKAWGRPLN